MTNLASSY